MKWTEVVGPMVDGGLAESERQLGVLAGGSEGLVSSSKARGRDISTDAMIRLIIRLDDVQWEYESAVMTGEHPMSPERRRRARNAYLIRNWLWDRLRQEIAGKGDVS